MALRGFSDIWASAQDISFWDIGLAGSVLIHQKTALLYMLPGTFPTGGQYLQQPAGSFTITGDLWI